MGNAYHKYRAGLPKLSFSFNWNGKLDGKVFTTIRRQNPRRFYKGARLRLEPPFSSDVIVAVADVRHCKLKDLSLWECVLDTGYSLKETHKIIQRMYKTSDEGTPELDISYVLLQKIPQKIIYNELGIKMPQLKTP